MDRVRRILTAMLLGVFVSLGVIAALLIGRRPGARRAARVAASVPAPRVEARRVAVRPSAAGRGGRRFAVALLAVILASGLAAALYGAGDGLWGRARPAASERDPTVRSAAGGASDPHLPAPAASDTEPGKAVPSDSHDETVPRFDLVRVAPSGEAVVAGRATRNATVDLLVDGRSTAQATSGADGHFTVTLGLPTGSSEIGLRVTDAQGHVRRAPASVSVAVVPTHDAMPPVALMRPDAPTRVLSRPDPRPAAASSPPDPIFAPIPDPMPAPRAGGARQAPQGPGGEASSRGQASAGGSEAGAAQVTVQAEAVGRDGSAEPAGAGVSSASTAPPTIPHPAGGPVVTAASVPPKIARVDARGGGQLFVTVQAAPYATVRLYLNDTLIAPATVARDGTVTFSIGRGVRPGAYRVRIDQVDVVTGHVRGRAEMPFSTPEPVRESGLEDAAQVPAAGSPAPPPGRPADPMASPPASGAPAAASTPGMAAAASDVHVPGIETTRIVRGDSLWKISRRTYGEGERYTEIYDANQDQIRDPDLIYPGQIFVLPSESVVGAGAGETHE